ncbi:MAG: BamA/TamA family outer membrane protein [Bacteroidia bacterium]
MDAKLTKYRLIWGVLVISLLMSACKATRHLEPDEYLLKSLPKIKTEGKLPPAQIYAAVKFKPNRRMLVPKTSLHIHNFGVSLKNTFAKNKSDSATTKGLLNLLINRWGEAPVIIDTLRIKEDTANLRAACFGQGYFHPHIDYEIDTLRKSFRHKYKQKARVTYTVKEGTVYKIKEVTLRSLLPNSETPRLEHQFEIAKSLIKPGVNYSHDLFLKERARATDLLRNNGYFTFAPKMLEFSVDSVLEENHPQEENLPMEEKWVNVEIQLTESPPRYIVRDIDVFISPSSGTTTDTLHLYAWRLTPSLRDSLDVNYKMLDSTVSIGFHLIPPAVLSQVNLNFIARRVHFIKDRVYRLAQAQRTRQMLQELGMFQYMVVNYKVDETSGMIDVVIELKLARKYQLKGGFESFTNIITSTNLPGVGINLSLRDKNALHKSEFLEIGLMGNVGFYAGQQGKGQFDQFYYEIGANANLNFHRFLFSKPFLFLVPDNLKSNLSRFSPLTAFTGQVRRENLLEYDRLTTGFKGTYRWQHIPFTDRAVSSLTPLAVDLIIINPDSLYRDTTINLLPPAIRRDFQNRFSSRLQYFYTNQNYRRTRLHPTYWYRIGVEWGGNLPYLLDRIPNLSGSDNSYTDNLFLDSLYYGQYIKASVEAKLSIPTGKTGEIVLRGIMGAATPYNHTPTVPQEARFFSGGTNSMRGWQSNTLGPGRSRLRDFQGTDTLTASNLIAPGGEYIFEANAEYRFDVLTYLEMAVFTDVGNVWFNNNDRNELVETAVLSRQNLRLGWDAGVGFRFDFSFLILRLDIAQQLYAPDLTTPWVMTREVSRKARRPQLNLGIGYPF